ncbi:MAG: SCP-like extracellular [Firmicutes bacterium]|nr:SCP-like extracellular [Bacillota bacterium]
MIQRSIKKSLVTGIIALAVLSTSIVTAAAATPVYYSANYSVKQLTTSNGGTVRIRYIIPRFRYNGQTVTYTTPKQTSGSTGTSNSTTQPQTGSTNYTSEEQQALALLNADRAANGLPALKLNSQLTALAESYVKDMISRGFFAHNNPEGLSPFDRMRQAGISYRYAGENLAINASVTGAESALMNSSGHRANILNANYTQVGIGVARSSSGMVYVAQEFIGL